MSDFFRHLPKEDVAVSYPPELDRSAPVETTAVERVRRRHEQELLEIDGVEGIATRSDGVVLYLRDEATAERIPRELEGVTITPVVTGKITAY